MQSRDRASCPARARYQVGSAVNVPTVNVYLVSTSAVPGLGKACTSSCSCGLDSRSRHRETERIIVHNPRVQGRVASQQWQSKPTARGHPTHRQAGAAPRRPAPVTNQRPLRCAGKGGAGSCGPSIFLEGKKSPYQSLPSFPRPPNIPLQRSLYLRASER